MKSNDLSMIVLAAGSLSVVIGGCSDPAQSTVGAGGSQTSARNSGGSMATGTGGAFGPSSIAQSLGGKPAGSALGGAISGGAPTNGGSVVSAGGLNNANGGASSKANGGTSSKAFGGALGRGGEASGGRSTTAGAAGNSGSGANGGASSAVRSSGGQLAIAGRPGTQVVAGQPGKAGSGGGAATGGSTSTSTGPCSATASKSVNGNLSGTGSHKVVMESNSDSQVACGTIYRPQDLGGSEKYPIFVWGEGGCSRDGKSNQAAMAEIASHGYFVIADGPSSGGNCPSISMPSTSADLLNMGKPMLGYIAWAIAENGKACSAYHDSLDTAKVAADGFSCGGLMAAGTAPDPVMTTYGITSSGLTNPDQEFYKKIHTPVKILLGGTADIAYENGARDYKNISALGIPVILLSKDGAGHGGDLGQGTGNFNSINLAWLNWQLKGDTTETGKGALFGATCKYCKAAGWEYKSANIE